MSEEWSEPFSTMFSPSWLCGVGERERLRRTGEQAGVLLFELLAVLKKTKETNKKKREKEENSFQCDLPSQQILRQTALHDSTDLQVSVDSSTARTLFAQPYIT